MHVFEFKGNMVVMVGGHQQMEVIFFFGSENLDHVETGGLGRIRHLCIVAREKRATSQ
jgi:hypothetical protein